MTTKPSERNDKAQKMTPEQLAGIREEFRDDPGDTFTGETVVNLLAHIRALEQELAERKAAEDRQFKLYNEMVIAKAAAEKTAAERRKYVNHLFEFHHCNCDFGESE